MTTLLPIPENMEIGGFALRERPAVPKPPAPIPTAYDLERHIGLVPFDNKPPVAKRNRELLNAALEAMRPDGSFKFTDGSTGPVLYPIQCAGKTFYFQGHIQTARKLGGCLLGVGGLAQPVGDGESGLNGQVGPITRFVRIDPDPKGCVLRIRSGGFTIRGIQFYGRPMPGNLHTGAGPKTGAGIQYEGRSTAQTTAFVLSEFAIADCDIGFHFLDGYYEDNGRYVSHEIHADNATLSDGHITNCRVGIRSDNVQAVWNVFNNLSIGRGPDNLECVIEANRGGLWKFTSLRIGAWDTTLLRVRPLDLFSPNAGRFDIHFYRDGFQGEGRNRLTLVECVGESRPWCDYDIRFSGALVKETDAENMVDLFRLNGLPSHKIWLDIDNIEHVPEYKGKWEVVGPWRRVK